MSNESLENYETVLQFFKVMANGSRLRILGLLADEEWSVGELAEFLRLKEPTVSHHLSMMKELGLVESRAEGTLRLYRLDTKALENLSKEALSTSNLSDLVGTTVEDKWEQKVLNSLLEGNRIDGYRIKEIPGKRKKQTVLLNWLATQFEPGVRYSESEISERLKAFHPDYASLRRYLVDHGLMQREKGIYWLTEGP